MESENIFQHLPVEIVVKIYKSMNDAGDVKATLSTCRRAKAIFDDNAGVIAKSHLLRTLHPYNIKMMVMAVASRDVDPQDEKSIEQFFRDYLFRADPWPASMFTMDMVAALPIFVAAMREVLIGTYLGVFWRPWCLGMTPTEIARRLRTCLMIETGANLFYRPPGRNPQTVMRTPHVEWVDKYWDVFSRVELEAVVDNFLREPYHESYRDSMRHTPNCKRGDIDILMSGYLGFTVGLENLGNVATSRRDHTNPDRICNLCLSLDDKWFGEWKGRQIETPYHDARRCLRNKIDPQPRFQPDPEAIDEETWNYLNSQKLEDIFGTRQTDGKGWLACWDSAIVTKYGEQMRKDYPIV
ncbi:hypothetical protein F4806DRAFT_504218 [Annulohypoxylon nitens]|nr:hypothetical protein F4806DRAFT_504218 [Annulohypoxylon nitens]